MDDQIDSIAVEIKGNIGFLDNLLNMSTLILETVGVVGVLAIVRLFLK